MSKVAVQIELEVLELEVLEVENKIAELDFEVKQKEYMIKFEFVK